MANKICYMENLPLDRQVINVTVPSAATVYQGNVLNADTLETGKIGTYAGAQVTDITAENPVIIINQDTYMDANGNRTGAFIYPGDYSYKETVLGENPITAVRLELNDCLMIGDECISNYDARTTEGYIVADNSTYTLEFVAAPGGTEKLVLKLETYDADIPAGKNFEKGARVRVIKSEY